MERKSKIIAENLDFEERSYIMDVLSIKGYNIQRSYHIRDGNGNVLCFLGGSSKESYIEILNRDHPDSKEIDRIVKCCLKERGTLEKYLGLLKK